MLNYVWVFMLTISFVVSCINGKMDDLSNAIFQGAQDAATLSISMLGVMCLWSGLSKIAEKSGLTDILKKCLYPITKFLFPTLEKNSPALSAIVMNITANLLGMGNAATPLGIKAMKELEKINTEKHIATDEMCMFAVINTASVQLLPSTLIALRQSFGSKNPGEIILPVWICGFLVLTVAISLAKIFSLKKNLRG